MSRNTTLFFYLFRYFCDTMIRRSALEGRGVQFYLSLKCKPISSFFAHRYEGEQRRNVGIHCLVSEKLSELRCVISCPELYQFFRREYNTPQQLEKRLIIYSNSFSLKLNPIKHIWTVLAKTRHRGTKLKCCIKSENILSITVESGDVNITLVGQCQLFCLINYRECHCFLEVNMNLFNTRNAFSSISRDSVPFIHKSSLLYSFTGQCESGQIEDTSQIVEFWIERHVLFWIMSDQSRHATTLIRTHSAIGDW